jgi:hypothetical protein
MHDGRVALIKAVAMSIEYQLTRGMMEPKNCAKDVGNYFADRSGSRAIVKFDSH